MAEELQRVGLVFKADGSVDFQKSLKEVNASIQENRSAFKLAQAQWDKNTKSADKLKDKQRYLKEQTKDYADKVKMLECQLKELESSENRNETAIEKKKSAINTAKTSLSHYEAELKEVNDTLKKGTANIEEYANKAKYAGEKIRDAGHALMPLSAATAGAGIAAGKMALDFEDGMAKINTLLDDTKELKSYRDTVMDVSSDMGIALETSADGMYQTISSLGDNGKETQKMFKTMAKSAKAGGAETADAVSLISAGMKGYGQVNEETAKKISDLAFQTAKLGVTTFPEMARSMQPLFPLSSALNLSYEDLFGTMATLTGVTGNTSDVTTQLKAVFSSLMKPTEAMSQLIHNYGYESASAMIEAEGFSGTLDILKEATGGSETEMAKLFGSTEALTAMLALTGDQSDTFKDKLYAMSEATGTTNDALDKTHTKGENLRQKMQELSNKFTEFGGVLVDNFAPIVENVIDKLTELADAFGKLPSQQQKAITGIVGFIAIVSPLLVLVGGVVRAIGTIAGAVSKISSAFSTLAGWVSTAYGVLAGFGEKIAGVFGGISISATGAAGIVVASILGVFSAFVYDISQADSETKTELIEIKDFWANIWNIIKDTTAQVWEHIKKTFADAWSSLKEGTVSAFTVIKNAILRPINLTKEKLSRILKDIHDSFVATWNNCVFAVKSAVQKIKESVNFHWKLPEIQLPKLPSIRVTGKFSLNPLEVPTFHWNAKAMNKAMLMQRATLFGANGSNVYGGGEAGPEMIVGERHLRNMILSASQNNNADVVEAIQNMENHMMELFMQFFPEFILGNVTIGERQLKRVLTEMGVKFA